MQYIGDQLCVFFDELVPELATRHNYDYHKKAGNITVYGRGGNGSQVAIVYESMPDKWQASIRDKYGDPYQYASKQPILNSIHPDPAALEFFENYLLPTGDLLPNADTDINGKPQINYVKRYTTNAEWLNMIIRLTEDKRALKRELNITVMTFWQTVAEMMKIHSIHLPKSRRHLTGTIKNYKQNGYESLVVDGAKFGNSHSKKVSSEVAEKLLEEMISRGHDDTIVAEKYSLWAVETGLKPITPAAVAYWRKKWTARLALDKLGTAKTVTKLSKQIKRDRPSAPLLLVGGDDNVLDVYFRTATNDWFRPALYVVMDAYNDYILGYAWGESITKDLIKEAYRNAYNHVRQLTGDAYCWQQIQSDRWGIGAGHTAKTDLQLFYESMATFTPATLKNAQAKYIERGFGTTWHQHLQMLFPANYSGHNIGAKKQINRDKLDHRNFPPVEQADRYIEAFVWAMRNSKRKGEELTRHQEWVQAFAKSDKAKKKLLSPERRLQVFGVQHSHLNQITAAGLTPRIAGQRYEYELSQQQIFQHIGKQVQIYYDPNDLNEVLVTDGKGMRFIAKTYEHVPSAIADYEEGDYERIHALIDEKKTLAPMLQEGIDQRKLVLERARIDAESRIKAGVLVKEIAHADQRVLTGNNHQLTGGNNHQTTNKTGGVDTQKQELKDFKKPLKHAQKAGNSIRSRY